MRLANRDQILAVVVAGRPRLWRGWPVDWDARQLIEEDKHRAQKVLTDGPVRIVHPTATEHRRASRAYRRTKARELVRTRSSGWPCWWPRSSKGPPASASP